MPQVPKPRPVLALLSGHRRYILLLSATSLLSGLAEAGFLVIITRTGLAVADGSGMVPLVAGATISVRSAGLVAAALVVLRAASAYLAVALSARLGSSVVAETRVLLARSFLRSSYATQQRAASGQLQELLTTFAGRVANVLGAVTNSVTASFNLVALLGLAIVVDPLGSFFVFFAIVVLGIFLRPIRRAVKRQGRRSAASGMAFATGLSELSQLGMEVHVFGVHNEVTSKVETLIHHDARNSERLERLKGMLPIVYVSVAYVALVTTIGVLALSNGRSLVTLGPVLLLMLRALSYGQAIQVAMSVIASASPFLESLSDRLSEYRAESLSDEGLSIERIDNLRLERVSFSYEPGRPALEDVTLVIPPKEIVGIVGPSGSGKSTLVQLILGIRTPSSGSILANGHAVGCYARNEWVRRVTFVPQEPHLFTGTIEENIRFHRSNVSAVDVRNAAKLAQIHDEIMQWPEGYQRVVGIDGTHLSGGQRQRLCIARALVERPDVLILDEPTSAVDVKSEALIRDSLLKLRSKMTVLIVAHRMASLSICDRIMVIQQGQLRAYDTPDELEKTNEFFLEALVLSGIRSPNPGNDVSGTT
jgi:ATP-binding cassette, subfamily B, bacterial